MDSSLLFSRWVKRRRAELDMTQERLADEVGCSSETVRAFEGGRRRPSRVMADRLADVLQIDHEQRVEFLRLARSPVERNAQRHEDTQAVAPSILPRSPVRLPIPPAAFIGRESEVVEIIQRLSDPACRLLTLIGAGGTGKTRLALHIAVSMADRFADGVHFVGLAQIGAAENVAVAIADVIGCPLIATHSADESLLQFLRDREMLLVLDNLEHLLESTPLLGSILREAPRVRLLTTSRERLRLGGEWVFELVGLATPRDDTRAAIDRCESVMLFLERARHVRSDFAITPANRIAVAEICRLLEGMPLGIELAAAWVRALTAQEIVAEVQRGLDFLALSHRDANPRHRSMRAAISHSWALLTPEEQGVMGRMSVFRGGCTREAAQAVTGATLHVLMSLLDKSLLRRNETGRYEMHELVRQYSADQLAADTAHCAMTRDRHGAYYANWLKSRKSMLQGPQQQDIVIEITVEIDNLRAAWQYAVDHRKIDLLQVMTEGTVLTWFYELRSWYREAESLTRRAVESLMRSPLTSRQEEILLANVLGNQGWHLFRCGQPTEGMRLLQQSLDMLRAGDHPDFLFISLEQLAYLMLFAGDFDQAIKLVEEQGPILERISDPWLQAHAAFQRAAVYVDRAPELAYERFHEGLPFMRSVGDSYVVILSLGHLGEIALALGKVDEAEQSFREARELSAGIGNGIGEANALSGLALVACAREAWRDAIMKALEAVARAREIGDTWTLARALIALGLAESGAGDAIAARANSTEALRVSLASHSLPTAIDAWIGLAAQDLADASRHAMLATLLAAVRNHPALRPFTAEHAAQIWTTLVARLNPQMLTDAEQAARLIELDQLGAALLAYAEGRAVNPTSFAGTHEPVPAGFAR